jgi:high affinity Mn2+ porin
MLEASGVARNLKAWVIALAVGSAASGGTAAADLSFKAAPALDPWSGYYVGGSVGYGTGSLGQAVHPMLLQGLVFTPSVTGITGGLQAGANRRIGSWVFGAETDAVFAGVRDQARIVPRSFDTSVDMIGSVRARLGYAIGPLLPYATVGVAFGHFQVAQNNADGEQLRQTGQWQAGWTAGLGIEAILGGGWSGKIEYRRAEFGGRTYPTGDAVRPGVDVVPRLDLVMLGLNYRLGDLPSANPAIVTAPALPEGWMVHGQFTFLPQGYPGFRSPYRGRNSLPGGGQGRETFTTSAFLGWKLWDGGQFLFNPELAQGFGLNSTIGLAGFPNGEAQKGGAPYPRFRAQRYILRQTFELGGGQEDLPDSVTQIGGKHDIDRITLSVGRFAVGDFFDGNSYAKDPRADFMNWALWASGAYDFPADLPGLTRGGVVELNRKDFAVRAGVFQVPSAPNSDLLTFNSGGVAAEFEGRYALWDQPGKLRLGAFANRGNTANYRGAIAAAAADPFTDINDLVPALRRQRSKTGFYLNAEQQLMPDLGAFARFSMNDGKSEILSFTDIDRSVSGGLSIKGRSWGRPADTIGIGSAVNGLSAAHRDFLAAGGLGLLIGDGRLNYRPERIFESYYAYAIDRHFTVTADYQLIVNPAYNSDRGPVSVFSARLHGEF